MTERFAERKIFALNEMRMVEGISPGSLRQLDGMAWFRSWDMADDIAIAVERLPR